MISNRKSEIPPPAVAPFDEKKAKEHQEAWAKCLGVPVEITNSIGMRLVLIPPGEFMMGSPKELIEEELKRPDNDQWYKVHLPAEGPQHRVRITKPFYLGTYLVTQQEYQRVMGTNPSEFSATGKGKDKVAGQDTMRFPVEQVSWDHAVEFCRKLSNLSEENVAGRLYRLPSEAQWEFACRAGNPGRYGFSSGRTAVPKEYDEHELSDYGWFGGNSAGMPHAVGGKKPNGWALYDMHGNVWEWCQDWYEMEYYANSPTDDPGGPPKGSGRVARGGGWDIPARHCRSADRLNHEAEPRALGLRVALVLADNPGRLKTAPSTESSVLSTQPAVPTNNLQPQRFVDVLSRVDPKRHRVIGSWTREGVSLSNCSAIYSSRVFVPVAVRGEYDLRIEFTRRESDKSVGIIAPVGTHVLVFQLSPGGRDWWCNAGDPPARHDTPLVNGRRYTLELRVRLAGENATVDASLDNVTLMHWQGAETDLKRDPGWRLPAANAIGLMADSSLATFHVVELKLVSGQAAWNDPVVSATMHITAGGTPVKTDPPALFLHDREVAEWLCSIKAGCEVKFPSGERKWLGSDPMPDSPFQIVSVGLDGKNAVTDWDLSRLRGLQGLKSVSLVFTTTSYEILESLSELPDLASFCAYGGGITDDGLKILGRMKKLRCVHLVYNPITAAGVKGLSQLDLLEELDLVAASLENVDLGDLVRMRNLRKLWLGGTQIGDAALAHLPALPCLTFLDLNRDRVADEGLEHLRGLSALTEIVLGGTQVTGKGLMRLHEALPNCTFHADPPAMEEYCTLVLQKEPNNAELHKRRADLLARYDHKWAEAAEDLAKVIGLRPDDIDSWHHRTMLLVQLQHKDLLSEHLGKMLAKFQGGGCVLHSLTTFPTGKPELIQGGEILADKFGEDPPWRWLVAFARYRAGKYKEAESLLARVDMNDRGLPRYAPTLILAFHAMTKAKLNDRPAAKELLAKAREAFKKAMKDDHGTEHDDYGENWWDRLSAEAVLAEAEDLIVGGKP